MFLKMRTTRSTENCSSQIERLKQAFKEAEAVVVGSGAGLSTSAGFVYTGSRFQQYFSDFAKKYGFRDMYSGGFYPYSSLEEHWGYWSRYIYINRYMDAPKPLHRTLYGLIRDKDYFVLTTNVDHCFQKAGFDKNRLFYTQGDYGLFQCGIPCHAATYDNEATVHRMLEAQGYVIGPDGTLLLPEGSTLKRTVPAALVPVCPKCGKPMRMNLREDDSFVEDAGWQDAARRYKAFLKETAGRRVVFLELGVGLNTPGIIKYPFWKMTACNSRAVYACINYGEAYAPKDILQQSICIDGDIGAVLDMLR